MRETCEERPDPFKEEQCGKPAVDFVRGGKGRKFHLCQHHYDLWVKIFGDEDFKDED